MRSFGLIGFPLSHSFSQKYFTEKFKRENITDCEFKNFSLEDINDFPALIKNNPTLCGLSITIPHKQSVIKFLDEVDGSAREVGAVNCIKASLRGKSPKQSHKKENRLLRFARNDIYLKGYNTDVFGFKNSLKPLLQDSHAKALILGTGGVSKAVAFVLQKLKIEFLFASRTKNQEPSIKYQELNEALITSYALIINATPLGMSPNINDCPDIPYEFLTSKHLLYDLTYNPEETLFLKKGKEKGAQIKNGLEMLHLQAEKAWEIWNS
ncbi:MAG: shikimate dehydrogenase [Bacteroidetes bacterium]|nr:shikimate dehydrogenase [Bacteroidota bacterium]